MKFVIRPLCRRCWSLARHGRPRLPRRRMVERPSRSTVRRRRPWSATLTFDHYMVGQTLTLHTTGGTPLIPATTRTTMYLDARPLQATRSKCQIGHSTIAGTFSPGFDHATFEAQPLQAGISKCHLGRGHGSAFTLAASDRSEVNQSSVLVLPSCSTKTS